MALEALFCGVEDTQNAATVDPNESTVGYEAASPPTKKQRTVMPENEVSKSCTASLLRKNVLTQTEVNCQAVSN